MKKEDEINALQEQLKKSNMLNRKFEKSSIDLNNLIHQQRSLGDRRGIGFEESKAECSRDQEVQSMRDKLVKHRTELKKIRQPLEEAFKLLMDREKEREELIKEVSSLKKMEINTCKSYVDMVKNNDERRYQSAPNNVWRRTTAPFTNNQNSARRQRYPNLLYGNCYTCHNFGHTATDCEAPMRRNFARTANANRNQIRTHNRYDYSDENPCSLLKK